jgi:hypothetical protein
VARLHPIEPLLPRNFKATPSSLGALGAGRPLDAATRVTMGHRLGYLFLGDACRPETPSIPQAIQRSQENASAPPAEETAIDRLDLAPKAKAGAEALRIAYPTVRFTSGKRSVAEQADAMAYNIIASKNRKWIENTYTNYAARRALQAWIDENPDATTLDAIKNGLTTVMQGLSGKKLAALSKHLTGEAFDVQPVETGADDIKIQIKSLAGLSKFLEREGNLVRWHAQFKRDSATTSIPLDSHDDAAERQAETASRWVATDATSEPNTRSNMPSLDLSMVRVHDNAHAAMLARAFVARAFTIGNHLFFAASAYAPHTHAGRRLLAHELVHVLQQADTSPGMQRQPETGVSAELAEAPPATTPRERVYLWLVERKRLFDQAETNHRVDRRAIAGAIAWEALENVKAHRFFSRWSGPGKVHHTKFWFQKGYLLEPRTLVEQVEHERRLPRPFGPDDRALALKDPRYSIHVIGALMDAFADAAAEGGYNIRDDPAMLANFYNAWDLTQARRHFARKRYPKPLSLGNRMSRWVMENLGWLSKAVGLPGWSLHGPPRKSNVGH